MNYPSYRSKLKIFKNIKLCIYMVESRARDLYFQIKISVQENIKINSHNRRFFKSGPLWTAMAHFGQMTVYIYIYIIYLLSRAKRETLYERTFGYHQYLIHLLIKIHGQVGSKFWGQKKKQDEKIGRNCKMPFC